MKRYEKYKNADEILFGEIPEHWIEYKMKYLVDPSKYYQIGDGDHGSIKPEMYSVDNGIPYLRVQNLSWTGELKNEGLVYITQEIQNINLKSKLIPDDILIAKTGATIGKLGIIPHSLKEANTTSSVGKITVNKKRFFPRFILYSMMSKQFNDQIWIDASQKSAQPGFNVDDFIFYKIVVPPSLEEQIAIANFLDEKTAEIDKLISDKQKIIKLINEEKNAIIDEVITKGIEICVKKKYSGIEWIGDIPEHWGMKKLRYLGKNQNGISKGAEYFGSGFPFLSYRDVYNNDSIPEDVTGLAQSSNEDRFNYSVLEGDIFFTRTSETVEEIGIASACMKTLPNATFSGFLIRFRPFDSILYKGFSKYYFRSQLHRKYFVKEMNLVTRASLSQDILKNLPVLIPPLNEQIEISNYLDERTAEINKTISKIEKEIELMLEYRTALISEVVTGKICLI